MCIPFQFDKATHTYTVDGGLFAPSVSHVLSNVGLVNYSDVPPYILQRAAELGTAVHSAIEFWLDNDLDESALTPEVKIRLDAFIKFKKYSGFVVKSIERSMVANCNGMLFGMTYDLDGILDGRPTLIDIKTSLKIMPWITFQTAAYEFGLRSEDGIARQRMVLQLRKDGTYKLHGPYCNPADEQAFIWALGITHLKKVMGLAVA